jgi:outer membrane protein TolC
VRLFVLCLLLGANAYAQVPLYELTLTQALLKAKHKSELLKSADAEIRAAQEGSQGVHANLLPKLSLEGSLRYVTEVPSIQIIPNGPEMPFGDHLNYTVGPTLSYVLWDGGHSRNIYKSQEKRVEARTQNKRAQMAQLESSVKQAYIKTQFALEQVKLLADSLKLIQAEHKDIVERKDAGTASNLDLFISQKEVLSYRLQYKQRQNELASSLHDLISLVEEIPQNSLQKPAPKGFKEAQLWVLLDPLEETLKQESKEEPQSLESTPPQLLSQDSMIQSLEHLAEGQESALYPQIQLSLRSSLDYPNGPVLKKIHQNSLSVGFSMPLYEFSKNRHLAAEKRQEAEALRHQRKQMETDIQREFVKAKDNLHTLREQSKDAQEIVKQSDTLARMTYEAYRIGRVKLVDVQAANLKALQAKLDLSSIHVHTLFQITLLKTLIAKDVSL